MPSTQDENVDSKTPNLQSIALVNEFLNVFP